MSVQPGNYDAESSTSSPDRIGCCSWFRSELCGRAGDNSVTMFGLQDPNSETIDLEKSFCTGNYRCSWSWLLAKLVLWGLTIAALVSSFVDYPYGLWFLAYISYWTLLYTCIYLTLSVILSILKMPPLWLIRATWVMYIAAAAHGLVVLLLFWGTEFGPDSILNYRTIMIHGGGLILCVMDGLFINKVPVRLRQYLVVGFLVACFVGWTVLQAYLPVDNRAKEDPDDNALYNIVDWINAPVQAAIVNALVLFVAMPLCTLLFWALSLRNRRYVSDNKEEGTLEAQDNV